MWQGFRREKDVGRLLGRSSISAMSSDMIGFQQADGIERAFEAEEYGGQKLGGGNFLFENSKYFHLPGMYGTSNDVEDSAD